MKLRPSVIGALCVAASSCSGGSERLCDPMIFPGVYPTSLAFGANGRGYLGTFLVLGDDCSETIKDRLYAVDAVTRTTVRIPIEFQPGKIFPRSDGGAALVMGYPGGVAYLSGTTVTPLTFGDGVSAIEPARNDGWIVSAQTAGSWLVSADGTPTQVKADTSACGAYGAGSRFLLCDALSVEVVDSAGTPVTTVPLSSRPLLVASSPTRAAVMMSGSIGIIEADSLQSVIPLADQLTGLWLSSDGSAALVRGQTNIYWLDLTLRESHALPANPNHLLGDAAFDGTTAIFVVGDPDFGTLDLTTGNVAYHDAFFGPLWLVERVSPGNFVLVGPNLETPMVDSTTVHFFLDSTATTTGAFWDLEL